MPKKKPDDAAVEDENNAQQTAAAEDSAAGENPTQSDTGAVAGPAAEPADENGTPQDNPELDDFFEEGQTPGSQSESGTEAGSGAAAADSAAKEKPVKRSRRKKKDEPPSPGETGESPIQPQSDKTPDETGEPPVAPRRRPRGSPIVSIDETRTVETSADKRNNDLLDLVESMKGKKILSGTIQGVERASENTDLSYAVIYHGDFKVIIPAEETVEAPDDFRGKSPSDVMHYLLTKRLGAEVDFIVKGVDKTGMAAASRLEAMAQKRKQYYFGTDRDGNNLLYEGINAEARVVSVIRAGIFVDIFGLEVYIPMRELSYQRGLDAAIQFQSGQRVLVKILTIDRSDRNNILVEASVKQATDNPYEKALRKYVAGNRYVGTVSMVDTNGVFVALDGGIDCLCTYPKRGRPPRGSRVTVRIIGINHESNRIWGAITHMTTAR